MICPKCKKKIKKQGFCPNCGENLEKLAEEKKARFHEKVYKIESRMTLILILLFVILLTVIIVMKQIFANKNFKQFETKSERKAIAKIEKDNDIEYNAKFELSDDNKEEDNDEDGLTNEEEVNLGTNPESSDTDGDLLSDYDEVKKHSSDPLKYSTAEDGISDYAKITLKLDINEKVDEGKYHFTKIETKNKNVTLIPSTVEAQAKGKFEEFTTDSNLHTEEKIFSVYGFEGRIEYKLSSSTDVILLTYYNGKYTEFDDYKITDKTLEISIDEDDNAKDFVITTNKNYKTYLKGEEK